MKWIQIAKAVLMLLPAIIAAMKALEEAIPGQGRGELKLRLIRQTLETAYVGINRTKVSFDDVWPSLQRIIGDLVVDFNDIGWGDGEDD